MAARLINHSKINKPPVLKAPWVHARELRVSMLKKKIIQRIFT